MSQSRGPAHVGKKYYSSLRSQIGSIFQFVVSYEKERWEELLRSQRKGPEQQYSISALQDEKVDPIKGNFITRDQNVQDRLERCIICNPSVSEIQEVYQIPVEKFSIRFLLPLLWALSSSSGFYKALKSLSLS